MKAFLCRPGLVTLVVAFGGNEVRRQTPQCFVADSPRSLPVMHFFTNTFFIFNGGTVTIATRCGTVSEALLCSCAAAVACHFRRVFDFVAAPHVKAVTLPALPCHSAACRLQSWVTARHLFAALQNGRILLTFRFESPLTWIVNLAEGTERFPAKLPYELSS